MADKKKYKFVAKVALKGDFDAEDGLGVAMQEIAAGQKASTEDKALFDLMIEQGHAKAAGARDDEEVAASADNGPKVETTDKAGKK